MLNNKGTFSLVGILFLLLISSIFYLALLISKINFFEVKNRNETYQCFIDYTEASVHFTKKIESLNKAIISLKIASLIPGAQGTTKTTIEILKNSQNILLTLYMKKVSAFKTCDLKIKIKLIKNIPYLHTAVILQRGPDELTIKKEKLWTINFDLNSPHIRKNAKFKIVADYFFTEKSVLKTKFIEQKKLAFQL